MVTGHDRPGVTSALCRVLDDHDAQILDVEQVVIRERLALGILLSASGDDDPVRLALQRQAHALGVSVEFESVGAPRAPASDQRHYVTVLGQPLLPSALAAVTGAITGAGGNIHRIARLSRYPITSFELLVHGGDPRRLREDLAIEAAASHVDVAVQRSTLYRRAKRLIVLDVDSTLVQGEVIELLAAHAGCAEQVAEITARAMAGELDFEASLRERVGLLSGTPASALDDVRNHIVLTPGAQTLVRTLRRLGYVLAIVSGGFTHITADLAERLGLDYHAANTLEVSDGVLTGRVVGPVVDRAAKADWLERFAEEAGVSLTQTVAVGDGANDLDMLGRAGLGIAFNAKPAVRRAADTAVSVPYLDAILFLLGITREEIEAADAEDPEFETRPRMPIPAEDARAGSTMPPS